MKELGKHILMLLRETVREWMDDGASRVAAALAYYTIFSLSPLLIIVAVLLGLAIDRQQLETGLIEGVETTVGEQVADLIASMILNVRIDNSSVVGTIVSLSIVVWGASNVFNELQHALNKIWEVRPKPGIKPVKLAISRAESFIIVFMAGAALIATLFINTSLSRAIANADPAGPLLFVIRALQLTISVAMIALLIGIVYKVLPDVQIHWKDVVVGAVFTSVLLFIGQFLVGLYLSNSNVGSVFGAAGSLTAILVWIYYSMQIFLFGAEFTEVWARHHGAIIRPSRNAVWVNQYNARKELEKAGVDFETMEREPEDNKAAPEVHVG